VEEVSLGGEGDALSELRERFDPRRYRLDVRKAPLLQLKIAFDAAQNRWLSLLLLHHLAGDHTTVGVIEHEVLAHLHGHSQQLPMPTPFRNLVARARLGVKKEEHERFFREMLGEVDEPTAPFGLLDVHGDGSSIAESYLELDGTLARRLRERARKLGVGAASLCHQAWALVLARLTGRSQVVFGTVLFGRMQGGEGAERGIGLFINTLPLKLDVAGVATEASVRRTQALLAELVHHEHASLALAQRCSAVAAPAPLFTSLLNYRHSEGAVGQPSEERTNYPLTLSIDDFNDGFGLTAQVHSSIEASRVCEMMRQALERLVQTLEDAPVTPIGELDVLPMAERRLLIEHWNATEAEYASERGIHELFEAQVARTPDATALVFGEQSLSYAELNRRANRLAHHLRTLGVKPDSRVAICAQRSLEMVVGLLAVLKAGGAYVPLEPTYPADRLAEVLADCEPIALLTEEHLLRAGLFALTSGLPVVDLGQSFAEQPDTNPDPAEVGLTSSHLAYVIYTSGSTGQPKGAMNEHRAVVNRLTWMQRAYGLTARDSVLQKTPFSFDVSVWEFFWPLQNGARLVMARPEGHKDPRYLVELIQSARITTLHFVPSMLQVFLEYADARQCDQLRRVMCSGEALPVSAVQRFYEVFSSAELHNLYGPTEAAVDVTAWRCTTGFDRPSVPIGSPIANCQMYALDAQLRPTPVGVAGELYIGGVQVGRGYLNRPDLTKERFVPDPFSTKPGARLYKTGDLGRWLPDGTIEFLGRNDFQVKIRGFRIELGEIEAKLLLRPELREAVVIAHDELPGEQRLVAYLTSDTELSNELLRTHLSRLLPDYMVPSAFIRLPAMPLTPNGKLDRRALPAPEADSDAMRDYEEPQGKLELQLAGIWARLLMRERVGRRENFFELGGHSLLTIRVVNLAKAAGIEIGVAALYEYPTVAELAAHVEAANAEEAADGVVVVRAGGSAQPLFLVHDGDGELLYAQSLAAHLDEGFPILGLPIDPDMDSGLRNMQTMASRMVRMMREVQPSGPYRIAGWSFGGALAYEVATQLLGDDQPVSFLGLFDTNYFGGLPLSYVERSNTELLLLYARNEGTLAELSEAEVAELVRIAESADFETLIAELHARGLLALDFDAKVVLSTLERNRRLEYVDLEFRAQALQIPVHFFRAEDSVVNLSAGEDADLRRHWARVVPDDYLRTIAVPGRHDSMFQEPHATIVAQAVSQALQNTDALQPRAKQAPHSPAIKLQSGRANAPPLYCLPGAGASITTFTDLVTALGAAWPVIGLQPRGLDGLQMPHTTVAAAAECNTRAILAANPKGPINLLGHSFGGWVAFETAQRLRAAGRVVGSLIIIDSEPPGPETSTLVHHTHLEVLLRWVELFELMLNVPLGLGREQLAAWSQSEQIERVHGRLAELGLMPRRSRPEILRAPFNTFAAAVRASYTPACVDHEPLFMAVMDDPKLDAEANRVAQQQVVSGWRRWAPRLEVYRAPGNHMTGLKSPHVEELASRLLAAIRDLNRGA
jgi:amino acid adenylation domain-containing protein